MLSTGSDLCCGMQKNHLNKAINKWKDLSQASHQRNMAEQKRVKVPLSAYPKLTNYISKEDFRVLAGFLTDYAALKYHLNELGKTQKQIGPLFQEDLKSAEHILCC